jgi:hypothetical protein
MKLVRNARSLKTKALGSLRRGLSAFNSYEEDGRTTVVLLHLQHACEMLVKAAIVQKRVPIFDKKSATSLGFAKCLNLAQIHCGLTAGEAGTMRAIDSLRDAEQHWFVVVAEQFLFLHARALVTVVDEVLKRSFEDALVNHLPPRILPISSLPPANIEVLMDREYTQIVELLAPGRRARDEARGRIRALLAMEAHVVEEVDVSEKDIDRIEKAIRGAKGFPDVFPRLTALGTTTEGEGISLKVHFTKKQGAPVKFVPADDPRDAAAVRELDLQKKYHLTPAQLARAVGLTTPKASALRDYLKLNDDPACRHVFKFGKSQFNCYSDNAVKTMKATLQDVGMDAVWKARKH